MIIKNVPYKSQWDDDATATQNDCGPASAAMIIAYYGENYSINDVFYKTGAGNGYISIDELNTAVNSYGFKHSFVAGQSVDQLKALIDQKIPAIALIKYGYLEGRQDAGFTGPHFMVVVGYDDKGVYCNDPNYWDARREEGHNKFYSWQNFIDAWGNCWRDGNVNNSLYIIYAKADSKIVSEIVQVEENQYANVTRKASFFDKIIIAVWKTHIDFLDALGILKNSDKRGDNSDKYTDEDIVSWIDALRKRIEHLQPKASGFDSVCIDYLQMPTSDNVTYQMIKTALDTMMKSQLNDYVSIGTYQAMETDRNKFKGLYEASINTPPEPAVEPEIPDTQVNPLQEYKEKYEALPGWLKWIVDAFTDTSSEMKTNER